MEALSPTMEEGRLVKWTKHEGDPVKAGDTLAEVETDKAVMELVARADGQLLKVMVPEGTTVPVGNVVAWIGTPGEKVDGDGAAAPAPKSAPAPEPQKRAPSAVRSAPESAPQPAPADATRVKASPLAKIRKTIAKRLAASIGPIPHFFLTTEIDMERAAEAREALNKQLGEEGGGGKISFNDIIIKAVALALGQHRACNAWFQDDHIRYWNQALQA